MDIKVPLGGSAFGAPYLRLINLLPTCFTPVFSSCFRRISSEHRLVSGRKLARPGKSPAFGDLRNGDVRISRFQILMCMFQTYSAYVGNRPHSELPFETRLQATDADAGNTRQFLQIDVPVDIGVNPLYCPSHLPRGRGVIGPNTCLPQPVANKHRQHHLPQKRSCARLLIKRRRLASPYLQSRKKLPDICLECRSRAHGEHIFGTVHVDAFTTGRQRAVLDVPTIAGKAQT